MIRLKEIREENKLLQKDIANMLEISQQFYSRYEKEEVKVPIKLYIKLAEYYNTSIDYLVGITDEKKPYPKIKKSEN